MVDQSIFVPLLPKAGDKLNYGKANDIERNIRFLIRQWPAFEAETIAPLIGSYGYLETTERASPAQGTEVTLLQHLPRLLVIFTGPGAETLLWDGAGWEEAGSSQGLVLTYALAEPSEQAAMEALRGLSVGSAGEADVTVSLSAEQTDGALRIVRENLTRMLFRAGATWGLVEAKTACWGDLSEAAWGDVEQMEKGDGL